MSRRPTMPLNVALKRARAKLRAAGELKGDLLFQNICIAQGALELMFPGITEDDIDFPSWEWPHYPSAAKLARHAMEMLEG